ncbi:MAG: O-linked N-acetylglucosamine transferase family protein [Phycisphaerae bacterium]
MSQQQLTLDEALHLAFTHHRANQLPDAEQIYRQILLAAPDHFDATHLLGALCFQQNRLDEAADLLLRAIKLDPIPPEPFYHLGCVLQAQNRFSEAITHYQLALARNPNYPEALNNLANSHKELGNIPEALTALRSALQLQPTNPITQSNLLLTLWYDPRLSLNDIAAEHKKWGAQFPANPAQTFPNEKNPTRRLRIGYVSPDFRQHPVTTFFEPILSNHDRTNFEIFLYAHPLRTDDVTARLRSKADQWRDITHLTDDQAAHQIRTDQIDLLIDLAGHTAANRLGIFTKKPAPLQATYLGYIGTTGLPTIDTRIADQLTDPENTNHFYTESLTRLPTPFAPYQPPADAPPVNDLPALKNGHITFASLNALAKLPDDLLHLWSLLLHALPTARLLIAAIGLADPAAQTRLRTFFHSRNIDPARLTLLPFQPLPQYLALHHHIDILLDTFPVNGHTITCHALHMGIPAITLAGESYASRLGASLLTTIGLPDLIAKDGQDYLQKALTLAKNTARLTELRATLRQKMHPLTNAKQITQNLEQTYRRLWQQWCKSGADAPVG